MARNTAMGSKLESIRDRLTTINHCQARLSSGSAMYFLFIFTHSSVVCGIVILVCGAVLWAGDYLHAFEYVQTRLFLPALLRHPAQRKSKTPVHVHHAHKHIHTYIQHTHTHTHTHLPACLPACLHARMDSRYRHCLRISRAFRYTGPKVSKNGCR